MLDEPFVARANASAVPRPTPAVPPMKRATGRYGAVKAALDERTEVMEAIVVSERRCVGAAASYTNLQGAAGSEETRVGVSLGSAYARPLLLSSHTATRRDATYSPTLPAEMASNDDADDALGGLVLPEALESVV